MGFDVLPDWAVKYNFTHHSPSGANRPNCLELFDKIIARPEELRSPANANMVAGTAVEDYCNAVIVKNQDERDAFAHALSILDAHKSPEHMPDDKDRFELFRNTPIEKKIKRDEQEIILTGTHFELVCQHALQGLREATEGANRVSDGRWVSVELESVELPFTGELDFEMPGVVELKTKWPYFKPDTKQGWGTNSLPAKPMKDHCRQVALYWKWLREQADNVPVKIVYANTLGYRVFTDENCEELQEQSLREHLDSLRMIARARETLMKTADDIETLFNLVPPDFSFYQWRDKPEAYKQRAREIWGI